MTIPLLDVASLFGPPALQRDQTDAAFMEAAHTVGFLQVTGLSGYVDITKARRDALKGIFALGQQHLQPLWRQKFAPGHANVYRGWFPLQHGQPTLKEGIDIGPDLIGDLYADNAGDPLQERTPLPPEALLPGWRSVAAQHYQQMSQLGAVLMRSIARGLHLHEHYFDALFDGGISTLRLIHYPSRIDGPGGLVGAPHVDSGLVTLLMQDGVSGLQVRMQRGVFIDVPAQEDALVVNFGRLLELWSAGRIKATEHQVLGGPQERFSFPFFYEPRVDANIAALPTSDQAFEPFQYGDFVWQAATRFVEFRGLEKLRPNRGSSAAFEQLIR